MTREAERRDRLRRSAAADGLDAVLVTNLLNVRYLTGFTGSNGALLLRADGRDLFGTDGRYTTQAGTQVPDVELLVDRGTVDGYHSDMTRTVVLGHAADWQREIYELVAASQAAGRAALAVGADVVAVDAASRDVIAAAGHGEHFTHGLGHGVGLEIHEAPAISALGAGTLTSGMAVTVEPGVYLPGHGGVRIEDTLVVTDDEPELLTLTSKELLVI